MKKEDVAVLAQLLDAIRENIEELEKAQKNKDSERVLAIKKEILNFQRKVGEIL